MLPVSRLVTSVRYQLRDMQGADWSDFEIIEALNRAAALLFGRMAEKFVHAALKKTALIVEDGGSALLPRDFHGVYKVTAGEGGELNYSTWTQETRYDGKYRIAGEWFYAPEGMYALEYYYTPRPVYDWNESIDAPESVSPYLERATAALLTGDAVEAEQIVQTCCRSLAASELSHFHDNGPVNVLGGKL